MFSLSVLSYTVDDEKHNKLGELFNGLKMGVKCKLYAFALIVRRTVFVVLLVVCVSVASRLLIGGLALLQLVYVAYVC